MVTRTTKSAKQNWDESFEEQIKIQAFNTSPVEALVRNASYYLRKRYETKDYNKLHFLEMGSGAGPNLVWLAQKGIKVSGVDISPVTLKLCRENFTQLGLQDKLNHLIEASATEVPLPDESFDGIFEACVFQHLNKDERSKAFGEIRRLLKPGGLFAGYMLDVGHTVYQKRKKDELPEDPGTLVLKEGGLKIYLTNIGITHFYSRPEFDQLLKGFSIIDPCLTSYFLPEEEAKNRGYGEYKQSMWAVYAVK
ncbi:hypothetical protein BVX98_04300 [bacterium F11]|nr:hypothetical protein BVX98_04300 [bacterium F11]